MLGVSPIELAVSKVIGYYLRCVSPNLMPETGQSHLEIFTTGFTETACILKLLRGGFCCLSVQVRYLPDHPLQVTLRVRVDAILRLHCRLQAVRPQQGQPADSKPSLTLSRHR